MSATFPRGDKNMFRHILRKDNELAHLLHQVTYVTASDIKKICNKLADLRVFSYKQINPKQ